MPFQSKKQEDYLRINNPDLHEEWVESYGHFKEAEEFGAETTHRRLVGDSFEASVSPETAPVIVSIVATLAAVGVGAFIGKTLFFDRRVLG